MIMVKYLTKLNIVFALQCAAVIAVIAFHAPRELFLATAGIIVFFVVFSPMEDTVLFIVRSIPVFVALPITEQFDSLNMWRIVVAIVFCKWFSVPARTRVFFSSVQGLFDEAKTDGKNALRALWRQWRIEALSVALFVIACVSLIGAADVGTGIKRILFFVNLGMLFFVVRSVARTIPLKKIAANVVLSGMLVVSAGFIQLLSAYTMDVDSFSEFWALVVNKSLYGTAWANIAIAANTWFAYYGGTIHLRMFSSFPDSHSFPLYLLMVAGFAITLFAFEERRVVRSALLLFIIAMMFEAVLSGTRGIWVSILFAILFLGIAAVRKYAIRRELAYAAVPLVLFLVSLPLAGLIFNSPQFRFAGTALEKQVFSERIRSIIDTEETSNQGRIFIWKATLRSMAAHPLFGVGIGNFPVVLSLNASAIKAGASAHNLYLNFFAELGVFGFIASSMLIYELCRRAWRMRLVQDAPVRFFAFNVLLYLIWIVWYSMTDVAIFDERAFLLLMVMLGTLFALKQTEAVAQERS